MAKYAVSQEIMDILDNNTWRDFGDINDFMRDMYDDNESLVDWIVEGLTFEDDNERFVDVIAYILTEREDLFEVEKPVMYALVEKTIDGSVYTWSRVKATQNVVSSVFRVLPRDYSLSFEEVNALYEMSNVSDKKIVNSNDLIVRQPSTDLPF